MEFSLLETDIHRKVAHIHTAVMGFRGVNKMKGKFKTLKPKVLDPTLRA